MTLTYILAALLVVVWTTAGFVLFVRARWYKEQLEMAKEDAEAAREFLAKAKSNTRQFLILLAGQQFEEIAERIRKDGLVDGGGEK